MVDLGVTFRIRLFRRRPKALQLFGLFGNLYTVLAPGMLRCRLLALGPFGILDSQQNFCEIC